MPLPHPPGHLHDSGGVPPAASHPPPALPVAPPPGLRRWLSGCITALAALALLPAAGAAETGELLVELNKTEEIESGGCRAFFLFRNQTGKSFEGFEMSLAILDGQGVIDRLLSVDAAPLPVQRTTLKLFEIPEIACSNISEILLHDITACQPQNEDPMDCFPILALGSRAAPQLVK